MESPTNRDEFMGPAISSERDISRFKPTGKHAEFRVKNVSNLMLRVTPTVTKTWSYLYRPEPKKRRKFALGIYPKVGLVIKPRSASRTSTDYS